MSKVYNILYYYLQCMHNLYIKVYLVLTIILYTYGRYLSVIQITDILFYIIIMILINYESTSISLKYYIDNI